MSKMTESKVLRKRLCFKPYKMLLVQALTPTDKVKTCDFCEEMQLKMEENRFVGRLISDEATFHISGKVNRHNVRIWGIEQPHAQTLSTYSHTWEKFRLQSASLQRFLFQDKCLQKVAKDGTHWHLRNLQNSH
ncbi:uncharacterized protein LOC117282272 [Cryptotermes secundus]|uniref:uncharacterized protein LOC117282272 n=1 Tax=Cryptotermes secundus TaxID=105785 RepID=UPI001454D212|nr:uncharacterized protein LOC117282272 [Cryptotermes secundus]